MVDANVKLWGTRIGAVSWIEGRQIGIFQYDPNFINSGIEVSPLQMPLSEFPYEFPALNKTTFKKLPGLLADSLPDKFGNALINSWLITQGRSPLSFNPVERLCYIGNRGMGALEFEPSLSQYTSKDNQLHLDQMVKLINKVLDQRAGIKGILTGKDDRKALEDILRVGTSAGGARAKAILSWNPQTNEFRSGQLNLQSGYQHWLLKFDGIANNRDKELADLQGFGKIEYAYYLIAKNIGIKIMESRLHDEGGRSHFMTKRFDRVGTGEKIHTQTLGALAHYDFNMAGAYSYEQAINVIKRLGLPRGDLEQQVLRAIFNVVGRNQDDHVKNITFIMNRNGEWSLSPAYDLTYSYNPTGEWTNHHQMSINGKRDTFVREDLIALARSAGIKKSKTEGMIDLVISMFREWIETAIGVGIDQETTQKIQKTLRLDI